MLGCTFYSFSTIFQEPKLAILALHSKQYERAILRHSCLDILFIFCTQYFLNNWRIILQWPLAYIGIILYYNNPLWLDMIKNVKAFFVLVSGLVILVKHSAGPNWVSNCGHHSSCDPGFESQSHHLRFFQFILLKLELYLLLECLVITYGWSGIIYRIVYIIENKNLPREKIFVVERRDGQK